MFKLQTIRILLITIFLMAVKLVCYSQTDKIEAVWLNQEKTAKIQVYKAKDGRFYGKMVWLSEPLRDGKPKLDDKNPDETKRSTPLIGLIILRHLEKQGENEYDGGKIYDPKNGKTYSCKITHKGKSLDLRGFVGISLIGRTSTWTLAE